MPYMTVRRRMYPAVLSMGLGTFWDNAWAYATGANNAPVAAPVNMTPVGYTPIEEAPWNKPAPGVATAEAPPTTPYSNAYSNLSTWFIKNPSKNVSQSDPVKVTTTPTGSGSSVSDVLKNLFSTAASTFIALKSPGSIPEAQLQPVYIPPPDVKPQSGLPTWLLPVGLGVVGLGLVWYMFRKPRRK